MKSQKTGRELDRRTLETIRLMAVERVREGKAPSAAIASRGFCRTTIFTSWPRRRSRSAAGGHGQAGLCRRRCVRPLPALHRRQNRAKASRGDSGRPLGLIQREPHGTHDPSSPASPPLPSSGGVLRFRALQPGAFIRCSVPPSRSWGSGRRSLPCGGGAPFWHRRQRDGPDPRSG